MGQDARPDAGPDAEITAADRHRAWVANVTAAAIIGFSVAWVVLLFLIDRGVYGNPNSAVEVNLYQKYAREIVGGSMPYRDFAFEYPPLALVPILLPVLIGGSPFVAESYRQMFELVEAGFGMLTMILIMWSVAALGRGRRDMLVAALMVAASPLLLGPLMLSRYDLFPALFAAAATWLLVTDRPRWAAVAVGLGVLAKVYPIVLAPFAIVYLWRARGRLEAAWFTGIMGAVVVAGIAPFLLIAPDGIIDALTRAFRRPIQVESLGAVLLYVRELLTGEPVRVIHTFDSYNLRGDAAQFVGAIQSLVLGAVLVGAMWLFVRGRPTLDRLVVAFAAALVAWVAFGRVFSPQYLIWLIAPIAIVASHRWSLLQVALVAAIVLTGLYYPRFYTAFFARHEPQWIAVVLGRDLVLVALTGYLLARLRRDDGGARASPAGS